MKHGLFQFCVFSAAFCLCRTCPAAPPNVVLILADDVGREVLGCYGGTSYATPHIDRLAASGARFQHFYSMPMCHPTRLALLTGRYAFRLGHPKWLSFPSAAESRAIGHVFKQAGYATGVAGKWQMTLLKDDADHPHRLGFDEYCVTGWHEGPWYYQPLMWENGRIRTDLHDRYGPDVECDYAVDFIRRNKDRPFFLYYAMTLCHAETNDLVEPAPRGPNGRYDTYQEMVPKMDRAVGRVVAVLDELGLRENTLILYCGDNGTPAVNLINAKDGQYIYEDVASEMEGRRIPGGKGTLADWGTRVPLIACQPGTINPNQVLDDLVSVADFLPTFVHLTGTTLTNDMQLDGQPIAALVDGAAPRRTVFSEHHLGGCYVRNQRWKLYDDGRFFDMDADPDERRPLAKAEFNGMAAEAQRELQTELTELNYSPPPK